MKKLTALAFTIALFSAAGANAAPPTDEQHLKRLTERLKLTEQQQQEFRKILDDSKAEREALRQQRRALHEKMRERFKAVLTPEQAKQYEQMRSEMPGRHGHGGPGRHGGR